MKRATRYVQGSRTLALVVIGLAMALLVVVVGQPADAINNNRRVVAWEDVQDQGGDGLYKRNGARLIRSNHAFEVSWRIKKPQTGEYDYPAPDTVPPGAPPHPPIAPGGTEVFTLWAFIFNNPELCTDPCNIDDIGDTPAQGGVYQLDGTVSPRGNLRMEGKVRLGQRPELGSPLQDPAGVEVHVAMAPHGAALSGADLARQLNAAIGTPAHWWVAVFIAS